MEKLKPVEHVKNGTVYLRVWVPEMGQFVHLGRPGLEKTEAKLKKLNDERATFRPAVRQRRRNYGLLLGELINEYLTWAKEEYPRQTYINYYTCLCHLGDAYDTVWVEQFGPVKLEEFQVAMGEKGFARGYILSMVRNVRRMFLWGVRREIIPAEYHTRLKSVPPLRPGRTKARETEPIGPPDPAAVTATIAAAAAPVAAMIQLQRSAGMRPQDVCNLRPCDVTRTGVVSVPGVGTFNLDELGVWMYRPAQHKGKWRGKARIVLIGPTGQSVLRPFLDRGEEVHCFSPREASKRKFRDDAKTKPKDRYSSASYDLAIEFAAKKAGVQPWNANQLRHAAALDIRSKYGMDAARASLGHNNPQTTTIYAPEDVQTAAKVAREIG